MFLLDKPFEVQRTPFWHFIINDALPSKLAKTLQKEYFEKENSAVWNKFIDLHTSRLNEITNMLDEAFGLKSEQLSYKYGFPNSPANNGELLRDWHIDSPTKKYHFLYYLGKSDPYGHTEFSEEPKGTNTKLIPFRHNRLIVFHNSHGEQGYGPKSWHRFYGKKLSHRMTWNMPLLFTGEEYEKRIQFLRDRSKNK